MADFLVALADFDQRRLWVDLGYSSLFHFLHRELGLSKGAAHYRKVAAGLLQRFPEVEVPLRDGRLCFTSVVELANVLSPENRDEVLPRFFHCSKREAAAVAAEMSPADVVPQRTVVTAVRAQAAAPSPVTAPAGTDVQDVRRTLGEMAQNSVHPDELRQRVGRREEQAPAAPRPRAEVVQLTAEQARVHVTVSRAFLDKVQAARDALSHSHANATMEEILEAGLDLLLERSAKRKGLVEKPRRAPPPSRSDGIPAHVKRAVWVRDGGCCQWKVQGKGICGSRRRIEFDHLEEKARGGPPTVDNVRLLCQFHNQLKARLVYGDAWIDGFTRRGRTYGGVEQRASSGTSAPA